MKQLFLSLILMTKVLANQSFEFVDGEDTCAKTLTVVQLPQQIEILETQTTQSKKLVYPYINRGKFRLQPGQKLVYEEKNDFYPQQKLLLHKFWVCDKHVVNKVLDHLGPGMKIGCEIAQEEHIQWDDQTLTRETFNHQGLPKSSPYKYCKYKKN